MLFRSLINIADYICRSMPAEEIGSVKESIDKPDHFARLLRNKMSFLGTLYLLQRKPESDRLSTDIYEIGRASCRERV